LQIYVINLDRRPDRLQEISQRLSALGLSFKRVPAVDCLTLLDDPQSPVVISIDACARSRNRAYGLISRQDAL
jgi:hypothetical protein